MKLESVGRYVVIGASLATTAALSITWYMFLIQKLELPAQLESAPEAAFIAGLVVLFLALLLLVRFAFVGTGRAHKNLVFPKAIAAFLTVVGAVTMIAGLTYRAPQNAHILAAGESNFVLLCFGGFPTLVGLGLWTAMYFDIAKIKREDMANQESSDKVAGHQVD